MPARGSSPHHHVGELDLRAELRRLCRLEALGGPEGPLALREPDLRVRRATRRPRTRMGFAVPSEWRVSVTAYPGARPGDLLETLLHELVHLAVGVSPGSRRWHGREFKETLQRAMREAYGVRGLRLQNSYHGTYAAAIERRRARSRPPRVSPGQLALELE